MSLLEKLWDDTVAGPYPDSGLGKLRKYSSFSSRSNSAKEASGNQRSYDDASAAGAGAGGNDDMRVTRSIMIVRPPQADQRDSPPASPAGSTPPLSPFAGAGGKEAFRFRRRSASFADEKARGNGARSAPASHDV